ncbi:hypothetical protein BGZ70_009667 [Mortierella alpina]|uniref:DUF7729 domain-containing protein n=1 Tax=Mortierella alpina TaxID=64518 RepID=A0A9P6J1F7_MORAP|nr:hypothetical protein BGZ70_009667 [Mortierella alpina]
MKTPLSASVIALGALGLSWCVTEVTAAISDGCSSFLKSLENPSNALRSCRVYTELGFPGITYAKDHDTPKLQKALSAYCATPACTTEQYVSLFKDLQAKCAADMVPENRATLGAALYMWYMSPPQREAICFQNAAKTGNCVIDSVNEMIARGQLPDSNPNEDDLYGYLQYVTPMANPINISTTEFCTPCNQQIANIFSTYYAKTPAPFPLNFEQGLTSDTLNINIMDQYQRNCGVTLGRPMSNSGDAPGAFQPTNQTSNGMPPPAFGSGAAETIKMSSWGTMVVILGSAAGIIANI